MKLWTHPHVAATRDVLYGRNHYVFCCADWRQLRFTLHRLRDSDNLTIYGDGVCTWTKTVVPHILWCWRYPPDEKASFHMKRFQSVDVSHWQNWARELYVCETANCRVCCCIYWNVVGLRRRWKAVEVCGGSGENKASTSAETGGAGCSARTATRLGIHQWFLSARIRIRRHDRVSHHSFSACIRSLLSNLACR